jgi:hypothetical protein
MNDPTNSPTPPENRPPRLVDALEKWTAETGTVPAAVEVVRLDANEKILVLFTLSVVPNVAVHYLDFQSLRGFVSCTRNDCLLCRIGRKADERDLLPVYDSVARAVAVLAVSPSIRPGALRPQLGPALQRVNAGERVLVGITKLDQVRFAVATYDLPDDADDGADRIASFLDGFKRGEIDLASVYPVMTKEELAMVSEIAATMKLKGITQ